MCTRCVLRAAGSFFSSVYVRASSIGTCTFTLQQCLFFQYIYVLTSPVQQYVARTAQQQVQFVRVQQVQQQEQQVRKYSNRYIGRCSTCVSIAAAVGTVVVGFVGTCVTALQRPGNAIENGEVNISLLTSILQLHHAQLVRVHRLCDRVRFFANTHIYLVLDFFLKSLFACLLVLECFFPGETTANICCLMLPLLNQYSGVHLKMSSSNRGRHLSLQVPLALR